MSASTNSISLAPATTVAWAEAIIDVRDGALVTARALVTLAGSAALLLGAVVVADEGVRTALRSALPIPAAVAESPSDEGLAEAVAEPAMVQAALPTATDPRQKYVVQYLSRRYRVAEEATRMLVSAAFRIGHENKMDPLLILSVVAIESSLNPFAESSMGAQGLMQVMTRVHADRFEPHGGQIAALDPVANMKVGSAILSDLISRGGSVERGLQLYVGAGNLPDDGGYGARVLGERSRLALAASGKVDAAISAGRTTVASEHKPATADATPPTQPQTLPAVESPLPAEEPAPARSA
jgi:soluble lytic murein transglycosylase-like protein